MVKMLILFLILDNFDVYDDDTMRSISFGVIGRVRDCSLSKFITWVVNSWQP